MTYNINYAYDAATQTIIEDRIDDIILARCMQILTAWLG